MFKPQECNSVIAEKEIIAGYKGQETILQFVRVDLTREES